MLTLDRTESFRSCVLSDIRMLLNSKHSTIRMESGYVMGHWNDFHSNKCLERWSLPQSRPRICPWDSLPSLSIFQQDEDNNAYSRSQAIYLSTLQITCLHSFTRHMPQRHQTTEFVTWSINRNSQVVWFRKCKDTCRIRTKCVIHLFEILSCSRIDFWCHKLHNKDWYE